MLRVQVTMQVINERLLICLQIRVHACNKVSRSLSFVSSAVKPGYGIKPFSIDIAFIQKGERTHVRTYVRTYERIQAIQLDNCHPNDRMHCYYYAYVQVNTV